jgi:Winged helix-turn-helix domain (DUF2582)
LVNLTDSRESEPRRTQVRRGFFIGAGDAAKRKPFEKHERFGTAPRPDRFKTGDRFGLPVFSRNFREDGWTPPSHRESLIATLNPRWVYLAQAQGGETVVPTTDAAENADSSAGGASLSSETAWEGVARMVTETGVDDLAEVGSIAGVVWHFLHENGAVTLSRLAKGIDAPRDTVMQGVGWLAREGKIRFEETQRSKTISLA